jgi:hypothetical protein
MPKIFDAWLFLKKNDTINSIIKKTLPAGISPNSKPQARPAAIWLFDTLPFKARYNFAIGFNKTKPSLF